MRLYKIASVETQSLPEPQGQVSSRSMLEYTRFRTAPSNAELESLLVYLIQFETKGWHEPWQLTMVPEGDVMTAYR